MAIQLPKCPVYLFYGTKAEEILKGRDGVLAWALTPETRNENLTEYIATSGETIKLTEIYDEIAGDFATMSFIADATKCAVVTNPAEIFSAARRPAGRASKAKKQAEGQSGKKTPEERLCGWIERELPQTPHVLILLAFEDEASAREVNEYSPLMQAVQKIGYTQGFRDTKAFFRIEEAVVNRQLTACLEAIRTLWKPGKGDSTVYNALVRCLRYLIQANIAREKGALSSPERQAAFFPVDTKTNLFKAHPAVQRKYTGRPIYRTVDLLKAYKKLMDVYCALRPRPGDLYVPDAKGMVEQLIVELLTSPMPR